MNFSSPLSQLSYSPNDAAKVLGIGRSTLFDLPLKISSR